MLEVLSIGCIVGCGGAAERKGDPVRRGGEISRGNQLPDGVSGENQETAGASPVPFAWTGR